MDEYTEFSTLQKKIIKHLENALSNTDTKPNIRKKLEKSHTKSAIYKSIERLEIRKVLIPSKTRSIFSESYIVRKQHRPHTVTLNKNNSDYIEYKTTLQRR